MSKFLIAAVISVACTGLMASLAYLARLPIQTLKIDRGFVASMVEDAAAFRGRSADSSLVRACG
jgi:EAL domain-containing protein (putative c-di-GMP-specific phosphodiesterase class I)